MVVTVRLLAAVVGLIILPILRPIGASLGAPLPAIAGGAAGPDAGDSRRAPETFWDRPQEPWMAATRAAVTVAGDAAPNATARRPAVSTHGHQPVPADFATAAARGINITGWFRFPPDRNPQALARYLSDQALGDLRGAGFDFIRLAVDPDVVGAPEPLAALIQSITRIERAGLGVIVSAHPVQWRIEDAPQRLRDFWRRLAPRLQPLDRARTVPELANEPVFAGAPSAWARLQHDILTDVRAVLPHATVVLTGADWGSINGLLALTPEDDPRVLYSFHFYDPPELTALAAYRPGLDTTVLARLPFPLTAGASCDAVAQATADAPTRDLVRYYCASAWTEAAVRDRMGRAAAWARAHHVHLLAGEFGASASLNAPARMAWLRAVRTTAEAAGIPWALWGYDDVMGLNISRPPPPRPALDPAVLGALGLTAAK